MVDMKKYFLLCIAAFSCNFSVAANLLPEVEKEKAIKVVKQFAETIACDVDIEPAIYHQDGTETRIKALTTAFEQPAPEFMAAATPLLLGVSFAVPWQTSGCSEGSGAGLVALTEVSLFSGNRYIVTNQNLFDFDYSDGKDYPNTRFIEDMKMNNDGQLEVITTEYQDSDSNCCPSLRVKYFLDIDTDFYSHDIVGENRPAKVIKKEILGTIR